MTATEISNPNLAETADPTEAETKDMDLRETIESEILIGAISRVHEQRQTEATQRLRLPGEEPPVLSTQPPTARRRSSAPLCIRVAGLMGWILLSVGVATAGICWVQPQLLAFSARTSPWVGAGILLAGVAAWVLFGSLAAIYRRLDSDQS